MATPRKKASGAAEPAFDPGALDALIGERRSLDEVDALFRQMKKALMERMLRGVHKVRYYGLWHPAARARREALQRHLAPSHAPLPSPPTAAEATVTAGARVDRCPACGKGTLCVVGHLPRAPSRLPSGIPP